MKQHYQRRTRRAIEQFREWANGNTDAIQLAFPTEEMAKLAERGLGERLRQIGKMFIENVMEAEVDNIVGPKSKPKADREAYRWGHERGYVVVDGQKVPVERPRVRARQHEREIPLGSYELFQKASLIEETVWQKIMYGLPYRNPPRWSHYSKSTDWNYSGRPWVPGLP